MAHFNWPSNISEAERNRAESVIKQFIETDAGAIFQDNIRRACQKWESEMSSISSRNEENVDYICKMNGVFEVFKELRDKKLGLLDG